MATTTGQYTIIDYYDAVSLTGFISANLALTQVFNPDNNSYNPSYSSTNLILTPSLFKAGSGNDLIMDAVEKTNITSIKWYDGATEIVGDANYTLAAFVSGTNRPLNIKANVLTGSTISKTYTCEIKYLDPGTGLELLYKTSITINRVTNSAGVTVPVASAPSGNIFKNDTGSLTAHGELWRGAAIDSSSVAYQWYKADSSVLTDQGGGIGWLKLASGTTGGGTSGWTGADLTIPSSAVDGTATFKIGIKDIDSTSPTYNQTFWATISYVDQTDPIQTIIDSTGGGVFKQGNGSTTLVARLYQNGAEIDAYGGTYGPTSPGSPTTNQKWYDTSTSSFKMWNGTAWVTDTVTFTKTYKWYKRDKDGNQDPNFGGAGVAYKTGKFLPVGGADVTIKATFTCEV
jgi:hypothetical protein